MDLLIKEFYRGKIKEHKTEVHSLRNAQSSKKQIQGWIKDVEAIQNQKVAPSVLYSRPFPSIDSLMQAFDPEMEAQMQKLMANLGNDSPLNVAQLTKVVCALLDIPVHADKDNRNLVESLHVLFSLFSAFAANDHFLTSQTASNSAPSAQPNNIQRIEFN